ncbi:MAG: hypothetical protein LBP87_09160 [Planctomycetaceae bacterium]|jgi:hypothetical protein|nr:hypothetical protein [Planctomycetaceae bacterium]
MAHNSSYMPTKDGEFIAWAETILRYCTENASQWNIDSSQLMQFTNLTNVAAAAYQVNSHLDERIRTTVAIKDEAFLNLKRFLQQFVNMLEGNPNISDLAIIEMELRPRHPSAHQPIPVPTEAPVITAVVRQHHDITVYASTLQQGHPTEFLTSGKYGGFLLQYQIENTVQWQSVLSTRLHYTLIFSEAEEAKHILLQGAWVNPRMQNGPWSEQIRELIN